MNIHPKAAAAGFGSALGVVIVGILQSIHGVHLDPTLNAAIPALLASFGSWLAPSPLAQAPSPPAGISNSTPSG